MAESAVEGKLGISSGITNSMATGIEFEFEPSILLTTARISKLGLSFRSFREPLTKAVKEVMMDSIFANFEEGGRPARWVPLSDATLNIRAWYGINNDEVMTVSNTLWDVASSFEIWRITQTEATINDLPQRVWYGKIHQAGYGGMSARIKKAGGNTTKAYNELQADLRKALRGEESGFKGYAAAIPARPFIMIQEEDAPRIEEVFIKWMEKKINEAWPVGT